jgi:hypothetical protein
VSLRLRFDVQCDRGINHCLLLWFRVCYAVIDSADVYYEVAVFRGFVVTIVEGWFVESYNLFVRHNV